MTPSAISLPFSARRRTSSHSVGEYTATAATTHGMLRVVGDALVIEWRVSRATMRAGASFETSEETDPVSEVAIPIGRLASAEVRRVAWWQPLARPTLILAAHDLRAFEPVAATGALALTHPSRLELTLARSDVGAGIEFAGELSLLISDNQLRHAELSRGEERDRIGGGQAPSADTPAV